MPSGSKIMTRTEMNNAMTEYPLPPDFIEQMKPLLGASLPDFLHSYGETPLRGIRMRPGLTPIPDALSPVPWAKDAYYLPSDSAAGAHPLHEAGAYYLQEPSAMAAAAALCPAPGDRVLDLCAAPGGKSTQLAAYLGGSGLLVCNEPVANRAQILSRNIERMGVPNAVVVSAMPEELSPLLPAFFDKILVDAPCSGEGMFRRHPETRGEWSAASPAGCAQRQSLILREARKMLRPGGLLAYSTCTFNSTENEGVIRRFLGENPGFTLVPFSLPGLPASNGMLHLWPHEIQGEGHFVALLRAPEGPESGVRPAPLPRPGKEELQIASVFLREHIRAAVQPNALFAGRLVSAPEGLPALRGIRVLRYGLQLGEVRGRNFFPDHALALALPAVRTQPVTADEAAAYQAGHPLNAAAECRGWYVPVLDGLQLGWGKASDGMLKNHYPKGLRK